MASRLFIGGPLDGRHLDVPDNADEYRAWDYPGVTWGDGRASDPTKGVVLYERKPNRLSIDPQYVFTPVGTKIGDRIRTVFVIAPEAPNAKEVATLKAEDAIAHECRKEGVGHSPILLVWHGTKRDSGRFAHLFKDFGVGADDLVLYVFEAVGTPLPEGTDGPHS